MSYRGRHRATGPGSSLDALRGALAEAQQEAFHDEMMRAGGGAAVQRQDRPPGELRLTVEQQQALDPALLRRFLDEHNLTLWTEDE